MGVFFVDRGSVNENATITLRLDLRVRVKKVSKYKEVEG